MKDETKIDNLDGSDNESQHIHEGGSRVLGRREFLGNSVGAAVLGAAAIGGQTRLWLRTL